MFDTIAAGTVTDMEFSDVEDGDRGTPPKFTTDVPLKLLPLSDNTNDPLPAVASIGEMQIGRAHV